ncbi:AraC family transcriptional regulator [Paraburkholderia tropica]|uniref:AraC family transcriptional regulator n=1 Tax=Paraburkholderia tropica TaxID=92647 RepID=UPI002AB6FBA6|nr:AraC family transcriptional regulator [Paraburkholderia tropica]
MNFEKHEMTLDGDPHASEIWSDVMLNVHGLHCEFDARRPAMSRVRGWRLGAVGFSLADLAVLTLTPVGTERASWQGDWLFVKLVTAGHVHVRSRDAIRRFDAGSLFVIDPAWPFTEIFDERARLTVLRIPKAALRERGVQYSKPAPLTVDARCADIQATRDIIQCMAAQTVAPSRHTQTMMGEQLIELIQHAVLDPDARAARRSSDALIWQAKRFIEQHIGDTGLDTAAIAGAVHVSPQHLQRVFRAQGGTPMRYVWQARLARAAHLLRSDPAAGVSIQEIAWQCGFATAAHFSRLFKQQYGEPPSDFRHSGSPLAV